MNTIGMIVHQRRIASDEVMGVSCPESDGSVCREALGDGLWRTMQAKASPAADGFPSAGAARSHHARSLCTASLRV
jgi:hypothetical protein